MLQLSGAPNAIISRRAHNTASGKLSHDINAIRGRLHLMLGCRTQKGREAKMRKLLSVLVLIICLTSACTEKKLARNFGGTTTTTLPKGQKLVIATWKEDSLWILTRQMRADETPETYNFKEHSSYGIAEGTAIIKEQ